MTKSMIYIVLSSSRAENFTSQNKAHMERGLD